MIKKKNYQRCLNYINKHWQKMTFYLPKDKEIHFGLPHKFISPSTEKGIFKNDQFYWDSYFIILGLVESSKVELAKGMVDNFAYLFKRFGIVPSRNRYYNLGISQSPFLTSMTLEVFSKTNDRKWLKRIADVAEQELKKYWMDDKKVHCVHEKLSRYYDHWRTHLTAEHESGWDMTSRFNDECLDYLPVDLNSCLYKYEKDLAQFYKILKNKQKSNYYLLQARKRKEVINKLMWGRRKGFFFDYNYKNKKQSKFYSLAGFYPMWSGLASKQQAEKCRNKLRKFEYKGGLANTQKTGLSKVFKQWDCPNGWANQQWIVVKGLLNYGYKEDAERVVYKWLEMNKKVFNKTGKFWEKYNVIKADIGKEGRYPNQTGFGWTNAIFVKLINEFCKKL